MGTSTTAGISNPTTAAVRPCTSGQPTRTKSRSGRKPNRSPTPPKPVRAAIYFRHLMLVGATGKDRDGEINLLTACGWTCVAEYHDYRPTWAFSMGRAIRAALADAARKEFDVLVVLRPALISLDIQVQADVLKNVHQSGIGVLSVDGNRDVLRGRAGARPKLFWPAELVGLVYPPPTEECNRYECAVKDGKLCPL
jgi:hypothetical protein